MTRLDYADKIWRAVNYRQTEVRNDPDYLMIDEELSRLPEHRLQEFYVHLMTGGEYLDRNGNPVRERLPRAVSDFLEILENEVWEKRGIGQKVERLIEKIEGVARQCRAREVRQEVYMKALKRYDADPDNLFYVDNEGGRHRLLDEDEKAVIAAAGGFAELLPRYLDPAGSLSQFREWIGGLYRRQVIRRELFLDEEGAARLGGVSLPRPGQERGEKGRGGSRVLSLSGSGVRRF